jgi:hypothetical protein
MSLTITFDPNVTTPQERIIQSASAAMDGMMTPLMVAKLAALWAARGAPDPTVVNRTMRLRITPSVTAPFGVLVPDASATTNGVITKAVVQVLEALFTSSGLPVPTVPNAPATRVRYAFSLQFSEITIAPATDRSCGVMTALMFAQLDFIVTHPTYGQVIAADNPYAWYRFNDAGGPTIVDTQGNDNGIEADPAATLYQQPGLITQAGQFSQGAVSNTTSNVQTGGGVTNYVVTAFSLEWWTAVQPLQLGQNGLRISVQGGSKLILITLAGTGTIGIGLQGGLPLFTSAPGVYQTTGNYFALTLDGANVKFYKNGVLVTSFAQPALGGTGVINLIEWGGLNYGVPLGAGRFGGNFDEVAGYKYVLTPTQIAAHYAAGIQ